MTECFFFIFFLFFVSLLDVYSIDREKNHMETNMCVLWHKTRTRLLAHIYTRTSELHLYECFLFCWYSWRCTTETAHEEKERSEKFYSEFVVIQCMLTYYGKRSSNNKTHTSKHTLSFDLTLSFQCTHTCACTCVYACVKYVQTEIHRRDRHAVVQM